MEKVNNEYVAGLISSCSMGSYWTILEILRKRDEFVENGSKESVGDDYPGITAEHLEAISRNSQADIENLLRLEAILSAKAQASSAPEQEAVAEYWVLFDAKADQRYIKKCIEDGTLAFFDNESDAKRAKLKNPGTDYKRVAYYTHEDDGECARLLAENESLLRKLRGKHALTGATYDLLIKERDRLLNQLADAQAQILTMRRELHALVPDGYTDPDAPLSATAQHA